MVRLLYSDIIQPVILELTVMPSATCSPYFTRPDRALIERNAFMVAEPKLIGNDFIPLVYDELRRLARSRLARMPYNQTLQPTELVHEVYQRLARRGDLAWRDRFHFFGVAAQAMRQILVDRARRRCAQKRGGDWDRITLNSALSETGDVAHNQEILAVHEALGQLQGEHPRKAEIVLLRYFAGLTMSEIAALKGVHVRTVERDWTFARVWLQQRLC